MIKITNTEKLKELIGTSGLKYKAIARKMGLTYYGLQKKVNNITEFKASEINSLCEILNIGNSKVKEDIFFDVNVELNSTDADAVGGKKDDECINRN